MITSNNFVLNSAGPPVVLYVDDEPLARKMFTLAFEGKAEVVCAESAGEARQILHVRRGNVAVVVSDERMPGETGLNFLASVRKLWPGVRRMLTTAYADAETMIACINRAAIHRLVVKPWTIDQLLPSVLAEASTSLRSKACKGSASDLLCALFAHELAAPILAMERHTGALMALSRSGEQGFTPAISCFPELIRCAEQLEADAALMRSLTGLFFELSQWEPALQDRFCPTSMADLVRGTCVRLKHAVGVIEISILQEFSICGSPELMDLLFAELLYNACDAVVGRTPPLIRVILEADDDYGRITVTDNGGGVDRKLLNRLFIDQGTTRSDGGGLGLLMCRIGSHYMGGHMEYRATPEGGSAFTLALPRWRGGASDRSEEGGH